MRVSLSLLLILFLGPILAGCRSPQTQNATTAAAPAPGSPTTRDASPLIVTPQDGSSGRIAMVNPNARYVVISFPIGAVPTVGRTLSVYRDGLKVGEIRVTGPTRGFNTVADIVAGECREQDQVREN